MKDSSDFLVEEYNSAVKLTYHIDELRNKLTSFFLIFAGLSSSIIGLFLEGKILNKEIDQYRSLSFILVFISVIGLIIIAILGRLRKIQFEHFNIINNIRVFFLAEIDDYERITILNTKTLPRESHKSGSFLWCLIISLTSSLILASSAYFLLFQVDSKISIIVAGASGLLFFTCLNFIYFRMSDYNYTDYTKVPEKSDKLD